MLELRGLHVDRGRTHVLQGVDLTVESGEIVTLIGGNGAGKTTVLMTISGLLRPRAGAMTYHQTEELDLSRLPAEEIVSLGIVHCPEGRQVFRSLSVRENLLIGAYLRHDKPAVAADLERMLDLFPRLRERFKQSAGNLSGGEQMMLSIGRALMADPKLLLLDEPSLGLAPQTLEQIFEIIVGINRSGTTILLVEQNASMALEVAHRGYVIETGRITRTGTGRALANDPRVREAYLGITS